jgi:RND family efflux transporter MFP subunit
VRSIPFIALAVALAACAGKDPASAGKDRGKGPVVVRVGEVRLERVPRVVEITGTLAGDDEVTVAAEVDGRVEKIVADLGDAVKAGGPLVRLAAQELRLRADQARAEYEQALAQAGVDGEKLDAFAPEANAGVRKAEADRAEARRNLERGRELFHRKLAAQGELDALETQASVAEATYQAALEAARSARATALARRAAWGLARKKLDDATIAAPVTGRVARRHVALGAYVKVGQPIADVVTTEVLELRGDVAERYAGLIAAGMPVTIHVDAGGQEAEGKITRVGPAIAASSRTFPVEAQVPNASGALSPGAFVRAEIRLGEDEEVAAVPETAVSNVAGVTKVFVESGGKAEERRVALLRKRGSDALLAGDLHAGDRVILTGLARLFDGADVKVDVAPAGAAPGAAPGAAGPDAAPAPGAKPGTAAVPPPGARPGAATAGGRE